MNVFPFLPLPPVILNLVPQLLWGISHWVLIAIAVACGFLGLTILCAQGFFGRYKQEDARIAFASVGIAAVIFVFHLWLILAALAVLALFILIYGVLWRMIAKNAAVALGWIKETPKQ